MEPGKLLTTGVGWRWGRGAVITGTWGRSPRIYAESSLPFDPNNSDYILEFSLQLGTGSYACCLNVSVSSSLPY